MGTVLLATDGTASSIDALRRAVPLLAAGSAYAVVSHAVPAPLAVGGVEAPMAAMPDPELDARMRAEQKEELDKAMDAIDRALPAPATRMFAVGDAAAEICRAATDLPADVIVVGAHDRGWLSRLLLGSVSDDVVHRARCPVLVVGHEDTGSSSGAGEASGSASASGSSSASGSESPSESGSPAEPPPSDT
jgi:nucleotide-binding universal stress UspA family protein